MPKAENNIKEYEGITKSFLSRAKKIGITKAEELILHVPKAYKDYTKFESAIPRHGCSENKLYRVKLVGSPNVNFQKGYVKLTLTDGFISVTAFQFGALQYYSGFKPNQILYVDAKVELNGQYVNFKDHEFIGEHQIGKVLPIYPVEKGVVAQDTLEKNIKLMLMENFDDVEAYLGAEYGLFNSSIKGLSKHTTLKDLFYAIHQPETFDDSVEALKIIRLLNAQSSLEAALSQKPRVNKDSLISFSPEDAAKYVKMLPFPLTPSQRQSVIEICKDLNSEVVMERLLSGDVGFGKTMTYGIPAVLAHKAKKNVIILTPNTLLSKQIAKEIETSFNVENVKLVLGDGSPNPTAEDIKSNPLIVGTTAILFWLEDMAKAGIDYKKDFVIIDEQQKMGNQQKEALLDEHTNYLEATATAIPRTVALVAYGNKKVSYLKECPVEKNITTMIVGEEHKKAVMKTIRKIVEADKKQVAVLYPVKEKDYMVCNVTLGDESKFPVLNEALKRTVKEAGILNTNIAPNTYQVVFKGNERYRFLQMMKNENIQVVIEEFDDILLTEHEKRNVESAYHSWCKLFPNRVVYIHGGLTAAEKEAALAKAKNHECDIIVTTSIIEIGLTLPDLMGLFVKSADRYGASTLHQFRGRLSRHGGKGLFLMGVDCHTSKMKDKAKDRLGLLVKYNKGYDIANDDMKQRGFGDLKKDGTIQKGAVDGVFKNMKVTPEDVENLISAIADHK